MYLYIFKTETEIEGPTLKFRISKKATKTYEISTLDLTFTIYLLT